MKVAYIMYPEAMASNATNGIRNQALGWQRALKSHLQVDCLSPWDDIDWRQYDVVHFFGGMGWLNWIHRLKDVYGSTLVFSPILDSVVSPRKLKLLASIGFKGYHHAQNCYRRDLRMFDRIYVRSDYEAGYFTYSYGIAPEKIVKIPLSYEVEVGAPDLSDSSPRKPFALHISSLHHERKNVERLIKAALRYGFELKLGGPTGSPNQTRRLLELIDGAPNIDLLGVVSLAEAKELYRQCGVFALPSLNEGVGLVALNAAAMGSPVVITSVGGPKEYYIDSKGQPLASIVDPLDIDAIGRAISSRLANPSTDFALRSHILNNYNPDKTATKLIDSYVNIRKSS